MSYPLAKSHAIACTATFGLLFNTACLREDRGSKTANIAFDKNARNYVVAFTGSNDGIPGVDKDLPNVYSVFGDPAEGLGFVMQGDTSAVDTAPQDSDTIVKHATTDQVLKKSAQIAAQMLADENATGKKGTMVWYLSSHGDETGGLITKDGCVYFSQIAKAMSDARGGVPLQRLVVFIDTCFSGQTINGTQAISKASASNATACGGGLGLTDGAPITERQAYQKLHADLIEGKNLSAPAAAVLMTNAAVTYGAMEVNRATAKKGLGLVAGDGTAGGLYVQLVDGAASSAAQESSDTDSGGAGTSAWIGAIRSQFAQNKAATFGDIERQTISGTVADGQTPVFSYDPPTFKTDTIFTTDNDDSAAGAQAQVPNLAKRDSPPLATAAPIDQLPAGANLPANAPGIAPPLAQANQVVPVVAPQAATTAAGGLSSLVSMIQQLIGQSAGQASSGDTSGGDGGG